MIRIDYSIDLTSKKIQDYSIFPVNNDKVFLTTVTYQMPTQNLEQISYITYLINQKQCQVANGIKILDVVQNTGVQGLKTNEDNCFRMLCSGIQRNSRDSFCRSLAKYEVDLIDEQLSEGRYLSEKMIIGLCSKRNTINLLDLKSHTHRYLKYPSISQRQRADRGQSVRNTVFDISQSEYSNNQINSFTALQNEALLVHLGEQQHPNTNSFLLKLDIQSKTIAWKHICKRFEKLLSVSIPFGQSWFVNGSYNIENNISSLNLYDFRVKGPVVSILHSNSQDILRLSNNRSLDPKFERLSRFNRSFKLMSLLSSGGGARSIPYTIDIRFPERLEVIEMASTGYLSHVRGLHCFNAQIYVIQRQFQGYKALKYKLVVYQFEI